MSDEQSKEVSEYRANQHYVSPKRPLAALSDEQRRQLMEDVLTRALHGETQADIARDLGLHQTGLSYNLLKYAEDEWKSVQVARALTGLDNAEERLAEASDMTSVARASSQLRSAQWQLERLHRRLFGQQQENVNVNGNIQINIGISRD